MPRPSVEDCLSYLASSGMSSWEDEEIAACLDAEAEAQAVRCVVPAADAPWPADLWESLRRRVARSLSMRRTPLGIAMTDVSSTQIRGIDVEISRLESGHRRWSVG